MTSAHTSSRRTFVLLIASILLLSSLIPGGPIENRDFSRLEPVTVLSFNIFLASLLLTTCAAAIFVWQERQLGSPLSLVCGAGFFAVYYLDLWEIFPVSPTPMSTALYTIEAMGLVVAVLLMALAAVGWFQRGLTPDPEAQPSSHLKLSASGLLVILFASAVIVAFATFAALNPQ